ncbi:hypothetical protein VIGAN_06251100, partial [Vigna angularis var. angularis]
FCLSSANSCISNTSKPPNKTHYHSECTHIWLYQFLVTIPSRFLLSLTAPHSSTVTLQEKSKTLTQFLYVTVHNLHLGPMLWTQHGAWAHIE